MSVFFVFGASYKSIFCGGFILKCVKIFGYKSGKNIIFFSVLMYLFSLLIEEKDKVGLTVIGVISASMFGFGAVLDGLVFVRGYVGGVLNVFMVLVLRLNLLLFEFLELLIYFFDVCRFERSRDDVLFLLFFYVVL